jgi:hypothetical protein
LSKFGGRARRRWPKPEETHSLRRSCSRKLEVLNIDARAPDNLKVGVRTSWSPQQQGSRDMVAAAMMGEREGSFKKYISAGGGATITAGSEAKTHQFGHNGCSSCD